MTGCDEKIWNRKQTDSRRKGGRRQRDRKSTDIDRERYSTQVKEKTEGGEDRKMRYRKKSDETRGKQRQRMEGQKEDGEQD